MNYYDVVSKKCFFLDILLLEIFVDLHAQFEIVTFFGQRNVWYLQKEFSICAYPCSMYGELKNKNKISFASSVQGHRFALGNS